MADLHPYRIGTLPITEETRTTLRALSAVTVADTQFQSLVTSIASSLSGTRSSSGSGSGSSAASSSLSSSKAVDFTAHPALTKLSSPPGVAAAAVRSLQAFFIDFAKCATPSSAVRSAIEEAGLSSSKAGIFADAYAAAAEEIRNGLANSGEWL